MAECCPFCEIADGRRRQEIVHAAESVVAFLCEPPAVPPWTPPEGGDERRRAVADAIRAALG